MTKAANYNITKKYGKISIKKIETPLIVTANSSSHTYDGNAYTDSGFTYSDNIVKPLDSVSALVSGTITDVGSADNFVTSVRVLRDNDDISDNYTIGEYVKGTLTVTPRDITITSGTKSMTYNGYAQKYESASVTSGSFVSGQGATYSGFASVTFVSEGEVDNEFSYSLNSNTKEQNYNITQVNGKISIKKITTPLIVTANSNSKDYDGTPLTDSGFT